MAPVGTPTRRKSRGLLVSSPASKSKSKEATTPRSTRRNAPTGLDGVLDAGELDEELIAAGTPSKRGRRAGGTAATTPRVTNGASTTTPASRKRKAEEMLDRRKEKSPEVEESIVVDLSTRSSGRARKKTTKVEENEVEPKKATKATKATKGTPKNTPSSTTKSTKKATPKESVTTSAKKPAAKGRRTVPVPEVEDEPMPDEPQEGPAQETEPVVQQPQEEATIEQQDATSTPGTTPRKRGRPKGSKNKKTLAKLLAEPPFEDISITPNSKARKLAQEAKAAQDALNAAIDAEARALEAKAKLLEQGVNPLEDEEATVKPPQNQTASEEPQPSLDALVELLKKPVHADAFNTLREEIILRLSGKRLTPLVGVEQEYSQVHSLIQQTVAAGEGNSMLVIGNRGSGKTTLVETALNEVYFAHPGEYHVIRLNGFVHTDDKVALKEIWRQLGKEMQLSDADNAARSNYADTLASLLAVLSHPAEITGDVETQQTSKSVVFILDEFDLFASHPRQTLLYNLFDIAQSRKAPIAVLGLTTKIDVVESLEKRVKSRFSHRYVHLPAARTYSTFLAVVKSALHCDPEPEFAPPASAPVVFALSRSNGNHQKFLKAWTAHISAALYTEPLASELRRIYAHSKSIPQVLTGVLPALIQSTARNPPTMSSLSSSLPTLNPPDSKLTILSSLSDAQLALLVSAARLDVILATDAVNFLLAADEYAKLAHRAKVVSNPALGSSAASLQGATIRTWGRDVLLSAWEALASKGLLVPVLGGDVTGRASSAVAADAGKRGRLWRVDVSLEEIARYLAGTIGKGGGSLVYREVERWCRNI